MVINAVDDNLLRGEQIDTRWSRDAIKVLPSLLHEARLAGRLVILLSDHGHVLDCEAQARPGDGGERWRAAIGSPASDELQVHGHRVLTESHKLIAPWSERVRYGIKKNGYHGGLTPQEMVIPIAVLASSETYPRGWHELAVDIPSWWDEPIATLTPAEQPAPQTQAQPAKNDGYAVQSRPRGGTHDADEHRMSLCPTGSDACSARPCSMSKSSSQAAEYHWTTGSSKSWVLWIDAAGR